METKINELEITNERNENLVIILLAGRIQTNTEKIEKMFVKAMLASLIDTDKVFCKTFFSSSFHWILIMVDN